MLKLLEELRSLPDLNKCPVRQFAAKFGVSVSSASQVMAIHRHLAEDLVACILSLRLPWTIGYRLSQIRSHAEQRARAELVLAGRRGREFVEAKAGERPGSKPDKKARRKKLMVGGAVLLMPPALSPDEAQKLFEKLAAAYFSEPAGR